MKPASESSEKQASNSCGTCRQQRVRCDRLLPSCRRCSTMRRKCQGYKRSKPLRWTNSLAIRGKLKGQSTFDQKKPLTETAPATGNALGHEGHVISRPLIEPDLQDLSWECRKYIRYFDLELSNECVVYNMRSTNPFLALMPLIPTSEALKHIMISMSAFHFSHRRTLHGADDSAASYCSNSGDLSPLRHNELQRDQIDCHQPLYMALLHKQKALECLKQEIKASSGLYENGLAAAAVLFICIDVVESGGMGWRYHLQGAKELVERGRLSHAALNDESLRWMQYFETACTTIDIMSSTLAKVKSPSSISETLDFSFLEILQKSEDKTWVGCPAELLYLLSTIHSFLSAPSISNEKVEEINTIQCMLQHFSPSTWAAKSSRIEHSISRFHLASAYKAAVEIYTSHVLGNLAGSYYLSASYIADLVDSAVMHMVAIPPDDFHIKSLVWPAFIIGAETNSCDQRDSLRDIFKQIWKASCCRNAKSAGEMLEILWSRSPEDCARMTWLEYMYEEREGWLFV
ncbi:fungal-specific transcription factor domain-containing protein [Mariannaea sp. PMI_226]|nr:fungal-specific transcription factor domain-containing protein [Mariannaea sp. PMI_226]